MSDLQETVAATEAAPANDGIAIPGEAAPANDTESRARAMGWVPKEDFRGPEDKWRDADEFVKRGEEELPILRERNRDLTRRFSEMEAKLGNVEKSYRDNLANVERMSVIALQRQREQLIDQYNSAMRSAVEIGDVSRYDQLNRDRDQAIYQFDNRVWQQVQPQQQIAPEHQSAVETWKAQNPWFSADPVLNMQAQAEHMRISDEMPGLSLAENLERTKQAIMNRFPAKFGITQQPQSNVEGGTRVPSSRPRQKSASDLPADVRRIADGFVKQGLFKDANEYAREYFAQGA